MAMLLGVPETRVNQAADHSLDVAALLAGKAPQAYHRMIADRLEEPTPGMLDILERRKRMIERIKRADLST